MKKDIEWLKGRFRGRKLFKPQNDIEVGYNMAIDEFSEYVDKLDEPEVNSQIDKLANFIMSEVEGEPSQKQGVVDTAIRIIKSYQNQETLSKDWIDKYSYNIEEYWEIADMMPEPQYAVSVENLQNVIVSNKKELDQAYKDGYDKGIELMEVMNMVYEDGEFVERMKK